MKHFFKILFLIGTLYSNAYAQTYFNNAYEIGGLVHGSTSLIEDPTGYLVLGQEITVDYRAMNFIKTNFNGDTLWTKSIPRSQYAYYTGYSNSLIKTYDNNLAFGGTVINLQDTTNDGDALLVKLNNNADTLWTRNYGGSGLDVANVAIGCSDSGYVLIGATNSFGSGQSDFYMVKTDSLGNFQWQKTFGTSLQEEAYSGINTLDGGYLLSGYQGSQLYIVKTDNNGNFQWQKTFAGTAGQAFVQQFADSTYILAGAKFVTGSSYQAYVAKLTKTGTIIWQQTYGGVGDQQLYTVPVILNDGDIVVAGITTPGTIPYGVLIKIDSSGNQQWLRTYYKNLTIDNYIYDLKLTSDEGFIMSGGTYVITQDSWLVKVDSNGCEIANCNVGIEEFKVESSKLNVYPNPASTHINISIEGEDLEDYEITIINIFGEIQNVRINDSEISVSELSSGIYFVSITSKDGSHRLTQKFVKE